MQIVSFGYTAEQSLLYGAPGGAIEVISLVASGVLADRLGSRLLTSMVGLTTALVGMILIVALPLDNNGGRLAGYYLTQASATPFVALLSLISTNVAGYTKKTTVAALYLIAYCAGNIIGTWNAFYLSSPPSQAQLFPLSLSLPGLESYSLRSITQLKITDNT